MAPEHSSPGAGRSPWRDPWTWVVLAVALLVRFAYLADLRHTPFFEDPQMDALYHDRWARSLAAGDWWGSEVFFRAPLYPYFLGALYALLGPDALAVRTVQMLLGGATALLTLLVARTRLDRPGAVVAGLLVALYAPLVYFEGELLLVVLEAPLFLVALAAMDRAWRRGGGRAWGLAGAAIALAALVRPTILAAAPVAAVLLLARDRGRALRPLLAAAAGLLLVLSPVLARNWIVGRDVVPVASQGGLNYYLGNNPSSDGMAALAPEFRDTWTGGIEDARRLAEEAAGRPLDPSGISRYWYGRALDWPARDPAAFLRHQVRKFGYFWDPFEIPNNQDYYYFSSLTRIFAHGWPVTFALVGPVALTGFLLGLLRRRLPVMWATVPWTLVMVIVAFFVCGRFRAPLVPLFALWAGLGVTVVRESLAGGRRRPLVVAAASLIVLGIGLNLDPHGFRARYSPAESHLRLGIHHASRGRPAEAAEQYRLAVEARPDFADAWNNWGVLRAQGGDGAGAREAFERALGARPDHAKALGNLAALSFGQGRRTEAESLARRALAAAGDREPEAIRNAGVVLGNLGRLEEARAAFLELVRLRPRDPAARLGAARALAALGRPREALAQIEAVEPARRGPELRELERRLRGGTTPTEEEP